MHQVYVISSPTGHSKIGISQDAVRRMNKAQTDNHEGLSLFLVLNVESQSQACMIEAALHRIFSPYHERGEWFLLPLPILHSLGDLLQALNCSVSLERTQSLSSVRKITSNAGFNRVSTATDKAYEWLIANPTEKDKPVRELAEIIGVGKDSVAKAKKRLSE